MAKAPDVEHRIVPKGAEFTTSGNRRPYRVEGPGLPVKSLPGVRGPNGISAWITEGRTKVWHWGNRFTFPPIQGVPEKIYISRSETEPVE